MFGRVKKIHLVGIGGSGMSGIAEVLINLGYSVSGSDIKKTEITENLKKMGATVFYLHDPENVKGKDVVVISSAIKEDNPEVIEAKRRGIPVIKRAEMLSELMRLKYGIAISGSHGKTTTSSMIGSILHEGGFDPTIIIGGRLIISGRGSKLGEGKFFVAEADESDGSFTKLNPQIVVITNIDEEHLDHYKSFENLKKAFTEFANSVPFYGLAILCMDDRGVMEILPHIKKRTITYGFSPQAILRCTKIKKESEGISFSVFFEGKELGRAFIPMKGEHNVLNALASIAVGLELEMDFNKILNGLRNFRGVHRRMEIKGVKNGILVIDDYGHHPTEIWNTLKTLREYYMDKKILVLFQPHRYTRTKLLKSRFPQALHLADILIITEVYPAGEKFIEGASGFDLYKEVASHGHKNLYYAENLEEGYKKAKELLESGMIFLTLGAGDVYKMADKFLEENN